MEKWVIRPGQPGKMRKKVCRMLFGRPTTVTCLRTMPILAAGLAGGCLSGTAAARFWLCPAGAVLLFWLCRYRLAIRPAWLGKVLPLLYLFAALRSSCLIGPAETLASQLVGQTFILRGTIRSARAGQAETAALRIERADGMLFCLKGVDSPPPYGTVIQLTVRGDRPDGRHNPGGFDEAAWLAGQGIFLIVRPVGNEQPTVIRPAPPVNWPEMCAQIRRQFNSFAARMFGRQEAALLTGLLLGDTGNIAADRLSDFRRSGLSHLTSVSGANVSLALVPVTLLVRRGRIGRRTRISLLLGVLVLFGFLTGWPVSVTRAILMTGFILAGQLLHRRADALNTLAAAAALLLLIEPLNVLAPGFWLSIIATASILVLSTPLTERWQARLPAIPAFLLAAPLTTLCAQLLMLPLSCGLSQGISGWTLFANLPAGPLAGWIAQFSLISLPLGALGSLLPDPAQAWLLAALGRPVTLGLQILYRLAGFFGQQAGGRLSVSALNPAFWLAWLTVLLRLVRNLPGFRFCPAGIYRLGGRVCLPAIMTWLLLGALANLNQPDVSVWFLDVGQGDAILIRTSRNETILIDGGPAGCGSNVLLPALDALGIRTIDLALATHGHSDHLGGLLELASSGKIQRLMIPAGLFGPAEKAEEEDLASQLASQAEMSGITVSELAENDTIVVGRQIRLQVLAAGPPKNAQVLLADGNDRSLILLATLAGNRLLLCADCTGETEQRLLAEHGWPQADLIKVAHHGSRLTTGEAFLRCVQPAAAIISVGPNVFGHPSAEMMIRLKTIGCRILRTDQNGAVLLTLNRKGWQLRAMLAEPD